MPRSPARPAPDARRPRGGLLAFALLAALLAHPQAGTAQEEGGQAALLERTLARALTPDQQAELAFLRHLGWRLQVADGLDRITVVAGTPCYRRTLAAAQAAGDLRILVPDPADAAALAAFADTLDELIDAPASRCAYQQRVKTAVVRATAKLAANTEEGDYTFSRWLIMDALLFEMEPPEGLWVEEGPCYRARASAARAIEGFYEEECEAECYVGQWIALYATQYELYGRERFDEVFAPEDLVIGKPWDIKSSPIGRYTRSDQSYPWQGLLIPWARRDEDAFLVLAEQGPKAFAGLSGIVKSTVEGVHSQDNFVVVGVTPAALEQLKAGGGLRYIRERAAEAFEHHQSSHWFTATDASGNEARAKRDAVLADPVFQGITLYVHPLGVVPLGDVVLRWMRKANHPVQVVPYLHGREDALYKRYRRAFEQAWHVERSAPDGPPAAPGTPSAPAADEAAGPPVPPPPPPPPLPPLVGPGDRVPGR